jgi:Ni,Fe-hydrogenase I small subunit
MVDSYFCPNSRWSEGQCAVGGPSCLACLAKELRDGSRSVVNNKVVSKEEMETDRDGG